MMRTVHDYDGSGCRAREAPRRGTGSTERAGWNARSILWRLSSSASSEAHQGPEEGRRRLDRAIQAIRKGERVCEKGEGGGSRGSEVAKGLNRMYAERPNWPARRVMKCGAAHCTRAAILTMLLRATRPGSMGGMNPNPLPRAVTVPDFAAISRSFGRSEESPRSPRMAIAIT